MARKAVKNALAVEIEQYYLTNDIGPGLESAVSFVKSQNDLRSSDEIIDELSMVISKL